MSVIVNEMGDNMDCSSLDQSGSVVGMKTVLEAKDNKDHKDNVDKLSSETSDDSDGPQGF